MVAGEGRGQATDDVVIAPIEGSISAQEERHEEVGRGREHLLEGPGASGVGVGREEIERARDAGAGGALPEPEVDAEAAGEVGGTGEGVECEGAVMEGAGALEFAR